MTFDAHAEIRLIVHRKFAITAETIEAATEKANALALAWMPTTLPEGSGKIFPAYEQPAITIDVTVIRQPEARLQSEGAAA